MEERQAPLQEARARELLSRERQRIEEGLAERERLHRDELEGIETALEPAEDAELIGEEQLEDALAATLREELAAVERAFGRLEEGSYGFSVESGEPIPAARLEAIPWAERTAEEEERYRRK